ncbi:MAG: hypothetical protein ACI8X5_000674 [Planctomycetota bacterium]|jgi:hypothetical protein
MNMFKSTLVVGFTLATCALLSSFDGVDCGKTGGAQSVAAGVHGPGFGSTSAKACKAVEKQMLTDTCLSVECGEAGGCWWGANWEGDAPGCVPDPLPTNPVTWSANITLSSGQRGSVSCSPCNL